MKILFYGTKPYDKIWFEPLAEGYGCQIKFLESNLTEETAKLAAGYDGVCVFVNNVVDRPVIDELEKAKVRVILLRCAGYNNVDIGYTKGKMTVLRVPSYSPEAVAEFTMGLILAVNRHIHRAYNRTREFNMTINGDVYKRQVLQSRGSGAPLWIFLWIMEIPGKKARRFVRRA